MKLFLLIPTTSQPRFLWKHSEAPFSRPNPLSSDRSNIKKRASEGRIQLASHIKGEPGTGVHAGNMVNSEFDGDILVEAIFDAHTKKLLEVVMTLTHPDGKTTILQGGNLINGKYVDAEGKESTIKGLTELPAKE